MTTTFSQICPVFFMEHASNQTGEKAKEFHGTKAFCVCDKGISDCGIADKIMVSLEEAGIETKLYDGVLPDAPDTMIDSAANIARNFDADIVIGIGGGSSLDAAKSISVLLDNPGPIHQYYLSKNVSFTSDTPLICIPTASGTGSEVTSVSVIHDHVTHAKETVIKKPSLAIVDPALTLGLSPFTTAITAMDALSHAVEAYTTKIPNPHSDALALYAIRLITSNIVTAFKDGSDLEARTSLSKASTLAGIAFNDAITHLGHAAAHEFGIRFQMPHGLACALTLPVVLNFAGDALPQRSIDIAKNMDLTLPKDCSGKEAAKLASEHMKFIMKALGIPSLKKQGITREEAVDCARDAYEKAFFIAYTPRRITVPQLAELIGQMYDTYQ